MADFKYYTIGGTNPQGKPRVYFTSHPKDQELYLERYKEEILKRQNCALYYMDVDSDHTKKENYEEDISGMQLFVIPVTARLLDQPCRAIDIDVPLAIKAHIPLLPIVEERGLDLRFQSRFGDLQYLDRTSLDTTAISFEEKLNKFLDSVIIGDELAKKVRAAFDTYIFLSYRKKDRAFAQKLMKLIHKNELCRDIAIWYDEFLTPGENFNDAIKGALEKSDLFALTVTPNLVNEENYVYTTEYPMARDLKKKILPVEFQPTDRAKLTEMYEDIPELVLSEDTEQLDRQLIDRLHGIAIEKNDGDPQHNFFIGLAYLSGIDVEVDHERAVSLIRSAADEGLPEAAGKLVSMYQNGEGVERSFTESENWLRRYVGILEEKQRMQPCRENAVELLDALKQLGDLVQATLGRWTEGRDLLEKRFRYAEQFCKDYPDDDLKRELSVSYERMGQFDLNNSVRAGANDRIDEIIKKSRERVALAESLLNKSLAINEELAAKHDSPLYRRDISCSHMDLAKAAGKVGSNDKMRDHLEKALVIREALAKDPGEFLNILDLSAIYASMGECEKKADNMDAAIDWFIRALQIRERIHKETEDRNNRVSMAYLFLSLGNCDQMPWNMLCYEKELSIWEELNQQYPDIKLYRDRIIGAKGSIRFLKDRIWGEEPDKKIRKETEEAEILKHPETLCAQFIHRLRGEDVSDGNNEETPETETVPKKKRSLFGFFRRK